MVWEVNIQTFKARTRYIRDIYNREYKKVVHTRKPYLYFRKDEYKSDVVIVTDFMWDIGCIVIKIFCWNRVSVFQKLWNFDEYEIKHPSIQTIPHNFRTRIILFCFCRYNSKYFLMNTLFHWVQKGGSSKYGSQHHIRHVECRCHG